MAVYRHYPDRKGLLNALADEGFRELAEALSAVRTAGSGSRKNGSSKNGSSKNGSSKNGSESSIEERLTAVLDVNVTFALENPRLFELMFLTPREGARQYPRDFAAGKSPTANLMAELVEDAMAKGYFRKDDVWAIVFETGALWQGLMMLYLGGRVGMSATGFRAFCHQSFGRYMYGIRA
jgi:AcrR family transcriptional regulator